MPLQLSTDCCTLLLLLLWLLRLLWLWLHCACRRVQHWRVLCWTCWQARHVSHLPRHTMQSSKQQQMKTTGEETGVANHPMPPSGFYHQVTACKQQPCFKCPATVFASHSHQCSNVSQKPTAHSCLPCDRCQVCQRVTGVQHTDPAANLQAPLGFSRQQQCPGHSHSTGL